MKQMFTSATFKLTAWYLLILMTICLLFSVIIYRVATSELDSRLGILQSHIRNTLGDPYIGPNPLSDRFRIAQFHDSEVRIFITLVYTNLGILIAGGFGSYFLARRTLEPIEEAHDAMSRFTSDASHELRTPLAVMKSELEVALRDPHLSESDMRELLSSNLEEVNRLSELSHMLLQLSRQDFAELTFEHTSATEIATKVVDVLNKSTKRITLSAPKKPIYVTANSAGLSELLMITLDNAMRYSPQDSKVDLSLTHKKTQLVITIRNEGKGISEKDLPHVFERFYRADKSRTSTSTATGYGLGLPLAKKIVDLHGGVISIASQPDKETTVTISLPITY